MANKSAAFNPAALADDIDEFLPERPAAPAATPTPPRQQDQESAPADLEVVPPRESERAVSRRSPKPAPAETSGPKRRGPARQEKDSHGLNIDIAQDLYDRLKLAQERDRASEAGVARTYKALVMDAITEGAQSLKDHWKAEQAAQGESLFPSRNIASVRESRGSTMRISMTGLLPADIEVFDRLLRDWKAPSYVALVTVALDQYLPHTDKPAE